MQYYVASTYLDYTFHQTSILLGPVSKHDAVAYLEKLHQAFKLAYFTTLRQITLQVSEDLAQCRAALLKHAKKSGTTIPAMLDDRLQYMSDSLKTAEAITQQDQFYDILRIWTNAGAHYHVRDVYKAWKHLNEPFSESTTLPVDAFVQLYSMSYLEPYISMPKNAPHQVFQSLRDTYQSLHQTFFSDQFPPFTQMAHILMDVCPHGHTYKLYSKDEWDAAMDMD